MANDENVTFTSSEFIVDRILDMDNVEATVMTFTMGDDTYTTHVATTSNHCNSTSIELDEVGDFASVQVNFDSVIDLESWIGIADAAKSVSMTPNITCRAQTWSNG